MDPSDKNVVPFWPGTLEYYEGWLGADGETKSRSGGLQDHDFHEWLDLKVEAPKSWDTLGSLTIYKGKIRASA